jgi:hypothetical protein
VSQPPATRLSVSRAAETFLLDHQELDGSWLDYSLAPGESLAWTTAYVGHVLSHSPRAGHWTERLNRAAQLLEDTRGEGGWSYNRSTSVDADSTAWAIRLLVRLDRRQACGSGLLQKFVGSDGSVHTFLGRNFGSWAEAHLDVAGVVGLAAVESGDTGLVSDIRTSMLGVLNQGRCWESFWWSSPGYVWAHGLRFLSVSGGVPRPAMQVATRCLEGGGTCSGAFDLANRLMASVDLAVHPGSNLRRCEEALLGSHQLDGGWASSADLRVPSQTGSAVSVHLDVHRLLTTATALRSLQRLCV